MFACARHAPATNEPPCDPNALARDLQVAMGPQACAADGECFAVPLTDLLPPDADQVPDMREWDPQTRPRIVTGPKTSERAVRRSLADLLESCPRTWNGRTFTTAVTTLPYATPGGNDLCSTWSDIPACVDGECASRHIEHLVDCGP